jgi:hypothetical protein
VLNQKKIIIFLSIIVFAVGCNAFVVPATFLVSGIMGNTTQTDKSDSSMRKSSRIVPSEDIYGTSTDHISGANVSKHISGTSTDHISGANVSKHISGTSGDHISGASVDHISGTSVDHISGTTMSKHISGVSIPEHLSGAVKMPDHLSGN